MKEEIAGYERQIATLKIKRSQSRLSIKRGTAVNSDDSDGEAPVAVGAPPPQFAEVDMWNKEHMLEATKMLFNKRNVPEGGSISWKSGDAMQFLVDFWEMHEQLPPRIPKAVFASIYSEVKVDSGRDGDDGLNVHEMAIFAERVHAFIFKNMQKEAGAARASAPAAAEAVVRLTEELTEAQQQVKQREDQLKEAEDTVEAKSKEVKRFGGRVQQLEMLERRVRRGE